MWFPVDPRWPLSDTFQGHLDRDPPSTAPGIDIACPSGVEVRSPAAAPGGEAEQSENLMLGIISPIMGGMMSQNILNLVDIGMVGHLGDSALAATGIGSFTNYLWLQRLLKEQGGDLSRLVAMRGQDAGISTRIQALNAFFHLTFGGKQNNRNMADFNT